MKLKVALILLLAIAFFGYGESKKDVENGPFLRCKNVKMDIAVVFDRSGCITDNYITIKQQFIKDMINQLPLGKKTVRLSCVSFEVKENIEFQWSFDKNEIIKKVNEIDGSENFTSGIAKALGAAETKLFHNARLDAKKIIILLSAGVECAGQHPIKIAQRMKEETGVTIISVGIGKNIFNRQLQQIASPDFAINTNYFDNLKSYFRRILSCTDEKKQLTIKPVCKDATADIVFILNKSVKENFIKMQQLVTGIMNCLKIGNNTIRLSCISYSHTATIDFDWLADAKKIKKKVWKIKPADGNDAATGDALRLAENKLLRKSREEVNKVIILMTDGINKPGINPFNVADEIKNSGVPIVVVGIGEQVDEAKLKLIASENSLFISNTFDELENHLLNLMTKTPEAELQEMNSD